MARTILTQPFVVDQSSLERMNGIQIDWTNVPAGYADATTGYKVIPAGTIMTKNGAQSWIPNNSNVALVAGTDEDGVLESDAYENDLTSASDNYGLLLGGILYENRLPDYVAGSTTLTGSLDGFRGFQTILWSDSRA